MVLKFDRISVKLMGKVVHQRGGGGVGLRNHIYKEYGVRQPEEENLRNAPTICDAVWGGPRYKPPLADGI